MIPGHQIPEALQAAEDIRTLFLDRVYERNFSGTSIRRDKIRLADEEAVMFLQGSWGPNEVMENYAL